MDFHEKKNVCMSILYQGINVLGFWKDRDLDPDSRLGQVRQKLIKRVFMKSVVLAGLGP